jgi:hypothetical protein
VPVRFAASCHGAGLIPERQKIVSLRLADACHKQYVRLPHGTTTTHYRLSKRHGSRKIPISSIVGFQGAPGIISWCITLTSEIRGGIRGPEW